MEHRGIRGLLPALVLALTATGCTAGPATPESRAVITVDRPAAPADEAVALRVTGLTAGERITVTSDATDWREDIWRGRAVFRADDRGTVDLTRARPLSGTYREADGMGLLWSMRPPGGDPDEQSFSTDYPARERSYQVRITVRREGGRESARVLTREWMAPGVERRALTRKRDGVDGTLFRPAPGAPRRPPVLLIGGSEGGGYDEWEAALLASRGHPALSLCYFGCAGAPKTLENIPLEYFAGAARLLARQPGADAGRLAVLGGSRGSEAALLLAAHHPRLVRDVIAIAPSDRVHGGFPDGAFAWTRGGREIESGTAIPVERIRGTVLAVAGGEDRLWDSAGFARSIGERRGASGPHRALIDPRAGHGVAGRPHTPTAIRFVHPVDGAVTELGGTRAADARARAAYWPGILRQLARP
jgi:pimeloyl-ACP methyl ester carboxylesterase